MLTRLLHHLRQQRDRLPRALRCAGRRRRLRHGRQQQQDHHGVRRQEDRRPSPEDPRAVQEQPDARQLEPAGTAGTCRVRRDRRGPQGAGGVAGARLVRQGPAGVSVWADVADNGTVIAGQGIAVQRMSAGTYQVTITDPTCAHEANAPVVSVSDAAPGLVQGGVFPVAWYGANGANQQFMVFTGVVSAGPPRDVHGD